MKGALFTYALTVIGAAGGIINPFVGLLVYVSFAIIRPEFMWQWSLGTQGHYSRIVGIALLLGWAVRGFGNWRLGRAAPIVAAMLGYWAWMVLSAVQATEPERAWGLVEFYAKVFLPFLVGVTVIERMSQVKQLLWVILLSQGYLAFELNLHYLADPGALREYGYGSMDNNCVAIAMVTGVGLAYFLGMAVRQWWMKAIALGSALLMVHVILFSFSRGGMLALGLTGLMAFVLIPKKPGHYLAFLVAILLVFRLAGPEVRERFSTTFEGSKEGQRDSSAESRLRLWGDSLDAALRHPLFGLGPDNWGVIAPQYGWPRNKEVHSLWMQNAAELGLLGIGLLLAFFLVCFKRLWPLARGRELTADPWTADAARMIVASLFGFVIAAQFVTIKYLETPFYVVLAGAALLKLLPETALAPRPAAARPWRPNWGPAVRRRVSQAGGGLAEA
jgi:probable O-glycosylation ligase (exosortase A-associated)